MVINSDNIKQKNPLLPKKDMLCNIFLNTKGHPFGWPLVYLISANAFKCYTAS